MMRLCVVLLFSVIASLNFVEQTSAAAVTVCPKKGSIAEGIKYHGDAVCNRDAYNQFKSNIGRHQRIHAYKKIGGLATTVPSQKTIVCPVGGARVSMKEPHTPNVGLDTVWFVENRASTSIVVSYVNSDGVEVSARNPKISPAMADPSTVLQPNQWMAVYAFEGHEFVVREVLKSGGDGGIAGNVLLQHRAGLIPVGVNAASSSLSCDTNQPDIEPKMNATTTARVFQRTPTPTSRPCNTIDIGFKNVAGCPLHGYYVHGEGERCEEQFKLHLGVESMTDDFFNDWGSATKFEGTFIGHTFHFRLASNPTVLVDTVTIAPIYVTDCPVTSAAAIVAESSTANTMERSGTMEFSNSTTETINNGLYDMLYPTNSSMINLPLDKPVSSKTI